MSLPEMFGYAAAAERLTAAGCPTTEYWLREHIGQVPHAKVGRRVIFTDALLMEFLEQQTKRPEQLHNRLQPTGRRRAS